VGALAALCAIAERSLLGSQVLPLALAKGKVSQSPQSRTTCCKILGSLASRLVRRTRYPIQPTKLAAAFPSLPP
jgi:hypothetical protein